MVSDGVAVQPLSLPKCKEGQSKSETLSTSLNKTLATARPKNKSGHSGQLVCAGFGASELLCFFPFLRLHQFRLLLLHTRARTRCLFCCAKLLTSRNSHSRTRTGDHSIPLVLVAVCVSSALERSLHAAAARLPGTISETVSCNVCGLAVYFSVLWLHYRPYRDALLASNIRTNTTHTHTHRLRFLRPVPFGGDLLDDTHTQ